MGFSFCPSGSASHWRVASATTPVLLLSASTLRGFAAVFNHSAGPLYIGLFGRPSVNDHDVAVASGSYYEIPRAVYRGEVYGVWGAADGWAMVTSLSGTRVA